MRSATMTADMSDGAVIALIARVLQVEPSVLDGCADNATVPGWDSLRTLMLASMIEISFAIRLTADEVSGLTSVARVIETVARHRA